MFSSRRTTLTKQQALRNGVARAGTERKLPGGYT